VFSWEFSLPTGASFTYSFSGLVVPWRFSLVSGCALPWVDLVFRGVMLLDLGAMSMIWCLAVVFSLVYVPDLVF